MKLFKKTLKLIGFIIIMIFASVGIGMAGAILPEQKAPMKKEDTIEMAEDMEEDALE